MILDGVLPDPALTRLATEPEKRRYVIKRLGTKLKRGEYPRLAFGISPNTTIRYFPDKLRNGVDSDGHRHVSSYTKLQGKFVRGSPERSHWHSDDDRADDTPIADSVRHSPITPAFMTTSVIWVPQLFSGIRRS